MTKIEKIEEGDQFDEGDDQERSAYEIRDGAIGNKEENQSKYEKIKADGERGIV